MLEVKNLTKVYKMKGGVEVRALDNISLTFPDKGMVFLLGKSGSGKSTLLNVCGGLDAPDQGEIIVKGRSSKDFSPQDFDSYRNTYVGFIFQEYNILNEFSVEDNIALALELQGKPKDKALIDKLLADVELQQFAKRKPNTLSGGQKQRVAIARALVKNPEVIMADEPTGALDSATGKQVFDTLKKLSQDKLVIVVSHDREFAEIYADRIIELKDGHVISDVVKNSTPAVQASGTYNLIGNDTIVIPSGSQLSATDLHAINKFLSQAQQDVLISRNSKDNANFKKLAKINDDNSKESFEPIKEQPQQQAYSKEDSKFLRSKLPLRHALKIGASNISVKPVRFTFTVLLSILSFIMFGLFACVMFFNATQVKAYSLAQSNANYITVNKTYFETSTSYYSGKSNTYTNDRPTNLTPSDLEALGAKYDLIPVYMASRYSGEMQIANLQVKPSQAFYTNNVSGIVDGQNLQYIIGSAPQDNEIAISQYLYDCIKTGTLRDSDNNVITVRENSVEGIVLNLFNSFYKVSGVYKQQNIDSKFNEDMTGELSYQWSNALNTDFYAYIATNYNTYQSIKGMLHTSSDTLQYPQMLTIYFTDSMPSIKYNNTDYYLESQSFAKPSTATYYNNSGEQVSQEVPQNTIVISQITYMRIVADIIYSINIDYSNEQAKQEYEKVIDALMRYQNAYTITYEQFASDYKLMMQFINKYVGKLEPTIVLSTVEYKIVGMYENSTTLFNAQDYATFMQNSINLNYTVNESSTDYLPSDLSQAIYQSAFINIDGKSGAELQNLLNDTTTPHQSSTYNYNNNIISQISLVTSTLEIFSVVLLYVGIALAVLSMLLLFNFISVSVANKKREIGILRAVGARSTDIFKIFFSESAIVVVICSVVSIIATAVLASVLNGMFSQQIGASLSLLVFNGITIAMIVGISIVTAFIATFLPVYNASRKKPVETIRAN